MKKATLFCDAYVAHDGLFTNCLYLQNRPVLFMAYWCPFCKDDMHTHELAPDAVFMNAFEWSAGNQG